MANQPADQRPTPPERPDDSECCRSGCDPCIFDRYQDELEEYRRKLKAWEARQGGQEAPLLSLKTATRL